MLVEHRGRGSRIDASAWVAPNAVLSGDVVVVPSARVLYGAVVTAERSSTHCRTQLRDHGAGGPSRGRSLAGCAM